MYQLLYVSHAHRSLSEIELLQILKQARVNNTAKGVTGLLIYYDGSFLQLLEGEQQAVQQTYDIIAKDMRHSRINIIGTQEVEERSFADWSMGFENFNAEKLPDLEGVTSLIDAMKQTEDNRKQADPSALVGVMSKLIRLNAAG